MRSASILLPLLLAATLSGCGGPSPKSLENRSAANARMNLVNSRVAFDQAQQAFLAGQFDRALREISNAISRSPNQADYEVLRGRILLETHRLQAAVEAFDLALEIDPASAEAHYYRGIVKQRWSRHDRALDAYADAFRNDPTRVQFLLAAAETEVTLGRLEAAEAMLLPQVPVFENHAAIHQLLGQIAMMRGDHRAAAQRFRRAQLLAPEDRMLLEELCRAQQHAGDLSGALATVRRLQTLEPTPCRDLLRLEARCLATLSRYAEARSAYIELVRVFPEDLDSWIELAGVAHRLGDRRRLEQCAGRIIMLAPDRWEGPFFRGLAERAEGRGEEAIRELRRATELAPTEIPPRLLLAMEYQRSGRDHDAFTVLAGVLRLDPDHPVARRLIAQVDPSPVLPSPPAAATRVILGGSTGFTSGLD
jgi:tetratricopeptide (TPR) repeat protein